MIKAVVDTNVMVSGIITPKGTPGKIIDAWQKRTFKMVFSPETVGELVRVLSDKDIAARYHVEKGQINRIVALAQIVEGMVTPEEKVEVIKEDPEDNKFLACAAAGAADCIVTGDKHLLTLVNYKGIPILRPREFLTEYQLK